MIKQLIAECTDYDFKENLEEGEPSCWLKSISAFANGIGGSLFFGIDDNAQLVGINDYKYVISKITELIKEKIEPIPIFAIHPYKDGDLIVVKIDVMPGQFTPYYYKSDGNMVAYIRIGDESVLAPSYILNELILKGTGQTYDSIIVNELKEDYSFNYLSNKYLSIINQKLNDGDIVSFGLANEKYLTRAGLLFADFNRLRQSRIFCTRWNGIDKVSEETVINDMEISGSILNQLDRAMDFFKANTKIKWKKDKGETIYYPDYDEEAIKEALVNAIVHRDYNVIGAEVVLNIYDDRLEITSPGGMYSGKSIPNVVDFVTESKRRNPIIADLFHRLRLMNRRGSGLANITNKSNKLFSDDKNHVYFKSDNEFFTVKIENSNYIKDVKENLQLTENVKLSNNEILVLKLIKANKDITIVELVSRLGLSRSTIIRIMNKLTNSGVIRRVGSNKVGYWEII